MTDVVEGTSPGATSTSSSEQISDDDLIRQYLTGNQEAFEMLYGRYRNSVYGFFKRQLADAPAQDAFQDTWIRLIDSLEKYRATDQFSGYLFTIAHNVLTDVHRRQARHPEPEELEADDLAAGHDSEPEHDLSHTRLQAHFRSELKKLPIHQRSVWILKQETDFTHEQIAKLTRSTTEGVKSRLRYANEKLRAGMQKYVRTRP